MLLVPSAKTRRTYRERTGLVVNVSPSEQSMSGLSSPSDFGNILQYSPFIRVRSGWALILAVSKTRKPSSCHKNKIQLHQIDRELHKADAIYTHLFQNSHVNIRWFSQGTSGEKNYIVKSNSSGIAEWARPQPPFRPVTLLNSPTSILPWNWNKDVHSKLTFDSFFAALIICVASFCVPVGPGPFRLQPRDQVSYDLTCRAHCSTVLPAWVKTKAVRLGGAGRSELIRSFCRGRPPFSRLPRHLVLVKVPAHQPAGVHSETTRSHRRWMALNEADEACCSLVTCAWFG